MRAGTPTTHTHTCSFSADHQQLLSQKMQLESSNPPQAMEHQWVRFYGVSPNSVTTSQTVYPSAKPAVLPSSSKPLATLHGIAALHMEHVVKSKVCHSNCNSTAHFWCDKLQLRVEKYCSVSWKANQTMNSTVGNFRPSVLNTWCCFPKQKIVYAHCRHLLCGAVLTRDLLWALHMKCSAPARTREMAWIWIHAASQYLSVWTGAENNRVTKQAVPLCNRWRNYLCQYAVVFIPLKAAFLQGIPVTGLTEVCFDKLQQHRKPTYEITSW